MGRHAQGWSLVCRGQYWHVRFRHEKRRYHISTGETDRERAGAAAAQVYADVTQGRRRHAIAARFALAPLKESVAEWLASIEGVLDEKTVGTYTGYATRWLGRWSRLDEAAHPAALGDYVTERLRAGLAKSLRKELSALFGYFGWCEQQGLLAEVPKRPTIRKTVRGTRVGKQREKAPDYSPEQIQAALDALPELGGKFGNRFPLRARFIVAYETGLRPATLDTLTWGHLMGGALRIDDEHDKARFGRQVPLSTRAADALRALYGSHKDSAALIFGRHDYRPALAKAAAAAGIPTLAPYDFRHNRATHLMDAGAAMTGVAYLLGHRQLTTTNRYAKSNERSARAMLDSGDSRDQDPGGKVRGTGVEPALVFTQLEPESSELQAIPEVSEDAPEQIGAVNPSADRVSGAQRPNPWRAYEHAVGVLLGLCAARGVEVAS